MLSLLLDENFGRFTYCFKLQATLKILLQDSDNSFKTSNEHEGLINSQAGVRLKAALTSIDRQKSGKVS